MAPTADSMEIVWSVNRLARGWVEFGPTPALGRKADCTAWGLVPQSDKVLRVLLRGLGSGETFHYRTVTIAADASKERVESAIRTFRTLNPAAEKVRFSVWNDTHRNDETIQKLHAATPASDFLLWNGDTCNDWTKPELIAPTILQPGGTDFSATRPVLIVRGNHDIRGAHAFRLSEFIATPGNRPFYSFRHGPVAFICLDTGEDKADAHPSFAGRVTCETLRAEQAEWLDREIQKPGIADAPFRVLFCHIPLRWKDEIKDFGSDYFSKRSRDQWHSALVRWGTQVVISGHIHEDLWMPPTSDFPYAQLIGGGPKLPSATYIVADADAASLKITQTRLATGEAEVHEFKPIA